MDLTNLVITLVAVQVRAPPRGVGVLGETERAASRVPCGTADAGPGDNRDRKLRSIYKSPERHLSRGSETLPSMDALSDLHL